MNKDKIIEVMARAFRNLSLPDSQKEEVVAQAALQALLDEGMAPLPLIATPEMINAVAKSPTPADRWEAMAEAFLLDQGQGDQGSSRIGGETCAASVASDLTGHGSSK